MRYTSLTHRKLTHPPHNIARKSSRGVQSPDFLKKSGLLALRSPTAPGELIPSSQSHIFSKGNREQGAGSREQGAGNKHYLN
ncbi:MAG: hypothetical protein F6K65_29585 [Moorea sp. SIO3C2]|nr:hypothetical protein [Moorena sp. SIO3C2]